MAPTPRTGWAGQGYRRRAGTATTRLIATYLTFGIAVLAGVYLIVVAGWELLLIGIASIAAGVLYTGGPEPMATRDLASCSCSCSSGSSRSPGRSSCRSATSDWEAFALAVPVGLIAAAILVVNNTRDLDTDRRAGKRTLAVRMGPKRSRAFYAGIVLLAYVLVPVTWIFGPLTAWLLLSWLSLPLALKVIGIVREHSDGPSLNAALARTGQLQLCFCVLLSAGLLLSR